MKIVKGGVTYESLGTSALERRLFILSELYKEENRSDK
jgi:hypothetical protein